MRVRVIMDLDVDAKRWAEGNNGQVVDTDNLVTALCSIIGTSNAAYDGEITFQGARSYKIDASALPVRSVTAYKTRPKRSQG